ncbi:threonine transporter RhtB [Pseudovibrio japonicus]|uniref:Threonine transporter RhtB n=1 Tax=Pseudovibrio japonicus TaxID=366534 RepID=A0ABQ3EIV1_9HYPH|nr:LysE family translocator [Pseudovibrio japonicus]GHB41668.1 threonine transporter RhtB [Pseudovibrio japonicus]
MAAVFLSLLLSLFPVYFLISVSPGLNMLAAMNIGASYGINRALPFVLGGCIGVALAAILSLAGVTAVMVHTPVVYELVRYLGAAFLCYMAYGYLRHSGEVSNDKDVSFVTNCRKKLIAKGFFTATLNPKVWLVFAALLPVFIVESAPLQLQIVLIITIVMAIEFFCMMLYAFGGDRIGRRMSQSGNVKVLNRLNAIVMFLLAVMMVFS